MIRLILSNPVYIGKVRYGIGRKDYYIGDGKHKPIINMKTWNSAQDKLSKIQKKTRTNKPKDDVYFCGTLVCGVCGKTLTTSRTIGRVKLDGTSKVFTSYRCVNQEKGICTARYVSHIKAEEAFMEYLENNVAEFDVVDDLVIEEDDLDMKEIERVKRLISSKKVKQREIMDLFMAEKLDYDKFKYMSEEIDRIINENELKVKALEQSYASKPSINKKDISKYIVEHWKNLTNKEKLEFLNQFVESITIVNRDTDRNRGKAEVLDVNFYDYKQ
jgi:hypothetical protein